MPFRPILAVLLLTLLASTATPSDWRYPEHDRTWNRYIPEVGSDRTIGFTQSWSHSFTQAYRPLLCGNVIGDDDLEIIFTDNEHLYIYAADGTELLAQDIEVTDLNVFGPMLLADIDGDDYLEIGVSYYYDSWGPNGQPRVPFFNGDGSVEYEIPPQGAAYYFPVEYHEGDVFLASNAGLDLRRWSIASDALVWGQDLVDIAGAGHHRNCAFADIDEDGDLEISRSNGTHNATHICRTEIFSEDGDLEVSEEYPYTPGWNRIFDSFVRFRPGDPYRIVSMKLFNNPYYPGTPKLRVLDIDGNELATTNGLYNSRFYCSYADADSDGDLEIYGAYYSTWNNAGRFRIYDDQLNILMSHDFGRGPRLAGVADLQDNGTNDVILTEFEDNTLHIMDDPLGAAPIWFTWDAPTGEDIRNTIVIDPDRNGVFDLFVATHDSVYYLAGVESPPVDPEGVLIADTHDFGETLINSCVSWTAEVENVGGGTLEILSVSSSHPAMTATVLDATADAGERATVQITFHPEMWIEALYGSIITIETNDPVTPSLELEIFGESVFADMSWDIGYGWTMFSLPYLPTGPFDEIFGDDLSIAASWVIAGYDFPPTGWFWAHDGGEYVPGMGYWLAVSDPLTEYTLDYEGIAYGCDDEFTWELDLGWNLIGCPGATGFDLADCVFEHNSASYTYTEAIDNGLLFANVYHLSALQGDWYTYGEAYLVGSELEPLKGYWLRTATEGLSMTAPMTPAPPTPGIDEIDEWDDWSLGLYLVQGSGLHGIVQAGVADGASDGHDLTYDGSLPPLAPNAATVAKLRIHQPDWPDNDYLTDIRSPFEAGEIKSWTIAATVPNGELFELHWPELTDELPDGYTAVLEDLNSGATMPLSPGAHFTFTGTGQEQEFALHVTAGALGVAANPAVPDEFDVVHAWPNPFNPSTTISFELEEPGNARVLVLDITGREVARLADGGFAAGRHDLAWHAGDRASGIYVLMFEGDGRRIARKICLMK